MLGLDKPVLMRIVMFCVLGLGMFLWELRKPKRIWGHSRIRRLAINFFLGAVNFFLIRGIFSGGWMIFAAFVFREHWGLMSLTRMPVLFSVLLTILFLDLGIYLQHVMFHSLPVLWSFHMAHHSDLVFDFSTGIRFHPAEILVSILYKCGLTLILGPLPIAVLIYEICLSSAALFNHGNVRMPAALDRALRRIVVTPDMHRVHHSTEKLETNSNFGNLFSFWDIFCGTYRPEPHLGQMGVKIGLAEYRDPRLLGLIRVLSLPFVD